MSIHSELQKVLGVQQWAGGNRAPLGGNSAPPGVNRGQIFLRPLRAEYSIYIYSIQDVVQDVSNISHGTLTKSPVAGPWRHIETLRAKYASVRPPWGSNRGPNFSSRLRRAGGQLRLRRGLNGGFSPSTHIFCKSVPGQYSTIWYTTTTK